MKALLPPGAGGSPVFSSGLAVNNGGELGAQGSVGDKAGVAQGPSVPAEPRRVALWSRGWLPSSTAQRLFHQRAPLTRWPLGNTDGVRSGDSRDPADPAAHTRLRLVARGCSFCTPTSPWASSPCASRFPVVMMCKNLVKLGLR